MRLSLPFAALVFSTLASLLPAQLPTAGKGSLVVHENYVFVLHDGVLFKFHVESLGLLGMVRLDELVPLREVAEEPMDEMELVEGEVTEEAVPAEPAISSGWNSAIGLGSGAGGGRGLGLGKGRGKGPGTPVSRAVDEALQWLSSRQDEDGKWDADGFMKHDGEGGPCDGPGRATYDVGVTGLSTLALLGGGSTMRSGPHKDAVKKAVKWLREQQQHNGLFGTNVSHDFIYGHAIATLAMCEAYGLSNFKLIRANAQKGINYLESHRNPYSVWRYQPRDNDNDTSVTTWAWLAYRSGTDFGLEVNPMVSKLVATWYDQVTDQHGKAGYTKPGESSSRAPGDHATRFPPQKGEALTAAALYARFTLGQTPKQVAVMKAAADLILSKPPAWDQKAGTIDPYYWWFGTQAMYQVGGRHWTAWRKTLGALVKAQRHDGNFAGSWDPIGVWDMDGGRVYSTALYALTLEVARRANKLVK